MRPTYEYMSTALRTHQCAPSDGDQRDVSNALSNNVNNVSFAAPHRSITSAQVTDCALRTVQSWQLSTGLHLMFQSNLQHK
jgi:hypothetical protein